MVVEASAIAITGSSGYHVVAHFQGTQTGRRDVGSAPFGTMALSHHDRRRILVASALTIVALPALWFANRPDTGAPAVATVGVDVDVAQPAADVAADSGTGSGTATDDAAPVFLDGPIAQVGAGLAEIAVPVAPTTERFTTKATFRSDVPIGTCRLSTVTNAQSITVVNIDNNRSLTCTTVLAPATAGEQLVMHPELFSQIADLTDAPIPVEIRR